MYEKFTDRARMIMKLANEEACNFGNEYIAPEHILLGLIKEGQGVAANVLKNLDINLNEVRLETEKLLTIGPMPIHEQKLPQTPRAKEVVVRAIEEAQLLGHNYVGTEHMLLGLLRVEDGVTSKVLSELGIKLEEAREEICNLLGQYKTDDSSEKKKTKLLPQLKCKIFALPVKTADDADNFSNYISEFIANKIVKKIHQSSTSEVTHISIWYEE